MQPSWTVRRISPKQYAQQTTKASKATAEVVTDHESELLVTVFYDGNQNRVLAGPVVHALKQTLATFGNLKAFHTLPTTQQHTRGFRVEFEDTRATKSALASLNEGIAIEVSAATPSFCPHSDLMQDVIATTELYQPDVPIISPQSIQPAPPVGPQQGPQILSATGRSTIPAPAGYDPMAPEYSFGRYLGYSPPRRARGDRYNDPNGNHNQVIIPKIEVGLDVRTTVSPSCLVSPLLLTQYRSCCATFPTRSTSPCSRRSSTRQARANTTSCTSVLVSQPPAQRRLAANLCIDFANNCNVGYAFINFVDVGRPMSPQIYHDNQFLGACNHPLCYGSCRSAMVNLL